MFVLESLASKASEKAPLLQTRRFMSPYRNIDQIFGKKDFFIIEPLISLM